MGARTVREFTASTDVWPIVEAWARDSKYALKRRIGSTRLYQKSGLIYWLLRMPPMTLQISQEGDNVHIQAWVEGQGMFGERGIESGGFIGSGTSWMMRGPVNELLRQLGQPPIK